MNNISIELCAEDRARLDAVAKTVNELTDAVAALIQVIQYNMDHPAKPAEIKAPADMPDDIQKALAEVVNGGKKTGSTEAAENAQEATKASDHPTLDPFPEAPVATEELSETAAEKEEPTVTMEMIRSKAITLAAAGKKDQVRDIVHPYAPKVTELPANVWAEVYKKLCKLEG